MAFGPKTSCFSVERDFSKTICTYVYEFWIYIFNYMQKHFKKHIKITVMWFKINVNVSFAFFVRKEP